MVNTTSYTFQGCTLTLTSQDTDGNTGIATLTGGGRFFKNSEVTVTAPEQPGYSFLGWYKDSYSGQPVSAAAAYTFVIREDMNLVAVYENAGTGLLHIIGSKYEVDDSGPQESSADFDKPVGKKVNLIYTGTDFQYWVNISNNIISTTPEYTFTMVGETTIRLVTSRDLETQQSVYVRGRRTHFPVRSRPRWASSLKSGSSKERMRRRLPARSPQRSPTTTQL